MHVLQYLVFSDGKSAAVVPLDDVDDEAGGELASLMEEVDTPHEEDGEMPESGEEDEKHDPEGGAAFGEEEQLMPHEGDNGELEEDGGQVAEKSVLPPWQEEEFQKFQESGEPVDECVPRACPALVPNPDLARVTALHTPTTPPCVTEVVERSCVSS